MAAPLNPKIQDLVARLNRDPGSKIFLQLAEEYRKAGLLEEALLVCKAGLKKHPGYQSARVALGRIYLSLARLEEARVEFEAVVGASPENLLANRMLGDVLALTGDGEGARRRYRAVVLAGPADNEIRDKLQALERGENPRQVGRWGNEIGGQANPSPRSREQAAAPAPPARAAPATSSAAVPPRPAAPAGARPAASASSPASVPARTPAAPSPASASTRPPAPGPAGTRGAAGDGISTPTLAELYVRQGFVDRAIEVYERLLSLEPGNATAARRLGELRQVAAGAVTSAPAVVSAAVAAAPAPRPAAAGGSRPPAGAGEEAVDRLERWLRAIQGGRS